MILDARTVGRHDRPGRLDHVSVSNSQLSKVMAM